MNRDDSYRPAMDALPLTGERTVPGVPSENYWFRRHEAAYRFAAERIRGRVLDLGCGEGYGAAVLSDEHAVTAGEPRPPAGPHPATPHPPVPGGRADALPVPLH